MPTQQIEWADGSGDKIYITSPDFSGNQQIAVSSDANTGAARSKVVTFTSGVGNIQRQLTINQAAWSRLPDGYTEYGYLESGGNAQLNTGVVGASSWTFTAQCLSPGSGSQILIGDKTYSGCWAGQANSKWGLGGNYNTTIDSSQKSDLNVTFASDKTTLTIGQVTKERNRSRAMSAILLFSAGSYYFNGRIFGDVIAMSGNSEVFHGVPCKNPNSVAGYYDLVTNSFFAPSSGTLTAGNE